jgi:hypothetical protein
MILYGAQSHLLMRGTSKRSQFGCLISLKNKRTQHFNNMNTRRNSGLLLLLLLYSPLLGLGRVFSFLILYTVGRIPWTGDQPVARILPIHRKTKTQNKRTQYGHPCLELDSNPRSQLSSERRQFMP